MSTGRIKPLPLFLEPFRSLPLVLFSLFAAVAAVDLLLAVQPTLLQSLSGHWRAWMTGAGISSPWASLMAAALSVAGVSVAAVLSSTFVRAVQGQPFVWLASLWVIAFAFILGNVPAELPLPLPTPLFAGLCALLLLGGATLLQSSSWLRSTTGVFLAVTPLGLLCIGYASGGMSRQAFDGPAQLLVFLLAVASIGAALIAVASRQPLEMQAGAHLDRLSEQVLTLTQRVRSSEARAIRAEQQLSAAEAQASDFGANDAQAALSLSAEGKAFGSLRPSGARRWPVWLVSAFVMGCGASLYFASYVPMRGRLTAELAQRHAEREQFTANLAALHAQFDRERAELTQQLTAARAAATAPASQASSTPDSQASGASAAKHTWSAHRSSSTSAVSKWHRQHDADGIDADPAGAAASESAPAAPPQHDHSDVGSEAVSSDPLDGI